MNSLLISIYIYIYILDLEKNTLPLLYLLIIKNNNINYMHGKRKNLLIEVNKSKGN